MTSRTAIECAVARTKVSRALMLGLAEVNSVHGLAAGKVSKGNSLGHWETRVRVREVRGPVERKACRWSSAGGRVLHLN